MQVSKRPFGTPAGAPREGARSGRRSLPISSVGVGAGPAWTSDDTRDALDLLSIDTVTPMESGVVSGLPKALELLIVLGRKIGLEPIHYAPAGVDLLDLQAVPEGVRTRAAEMGPSFWSNQPNLVLALGRRQSAERTLVINVHVDTVGAYEPAHVTPDGRLFGRGAVDVKAAGIAVLAGLRRAVATSSALVDSVSILVQFVGGEEGGAMGIYGTRMLVDAGYHGRLNVVVEPTSMKAFDRTTASMTARVEVDGRGASDDAPDTGHNASVLLGALAAGFAEGLPEELARRSMSLCIAGLHTGHTHNRVFGTGTLLLNVAYPTTSAAIDGRALVERRFEQLVTDFGHRFGTSPLIGMTARDASDTCSLRWIKQGFPTLTPPSGGVDPVLGRSGITMAGADDRALTCDAGWFAGLPGSSTVVLGPGAVDANCAHAAGEWISISDLDRFAGVTAEVALSFAAEIGVQ